MYHALQTWSCLLTYLTVAVVQCSFFFLEYSPPFLHRHLSRSNGSVVGGDGFWARLVLREACCSVEASRCVALNGGILGLAWCGRDGLCCGRAFAVAGCAACLSWVGESGEVRLWGCGLFRAWLGFRSLEPCCGGGLVG